MIYNTNYKLLTNYMNNEYNKVLLLNILGDKNLKKCNDRHNISNINFGTGNTCNSCRPGPQGPAGSTGPQGQGLKDLQEIVAVKIQ